MSEENKYVCTKISKVYEYPSSIRDGRIQIKPESSELLVRWLLQNEGEIAYDLRGYGVLTGTFEDLIKRKPLKGNLGGTYR